MLPFDTGSILQALSEALERLETAIEDTEEVAKSTNNTGLVARLSDYKQVCRTQRRLIQELKDKIACEDFEALHPIINKINGLSALVRDDSHAILSGGTKVREEDLN